MQVREVMSKNPEFITADQTLQQAAQKMEQLDCGFLPVRGNGDKLDGVLTDRDIVLRAVAEGKDLQHTKAKDILTNKVLYCFEQDSLEEAAESMKKQQVYRLVVLNNPNEKRLCGIVTLGDIARTRKEAGLVGNTACCVAEAAA